MCVNAAKDTHTEDVVLLSFSILVTSEGTSFVSLDRIKNPSSLILLLLLLAYPPPERNESSLNEWNSLCWQPHKHSIQQRLMDGWMDGWVDVGLVQRYSSWADKRTTDYHKSREGDESYRLLSIEFLFCCSDQNLNYSFIKHINALQNISYCKLFSSVHNRHM